MTGLAFALGTALAMALLTWGIIREERSKAPRRAITLQAALDVRAGAFARLARLDEEDDE